MISICETSHNGNEYDLRFKSSIKTLKRIEIYSIQILSEHRIEAPMDTFMITFTDMYSGFTLRINETHPYVSKLYMLFFKRSADSHMT